MGDSWNRSVFDPSSSRPKGREAQTSSDLVALNADVVGYSRLLAEDAETTTRAMEEYRRTVADEIASAGGTLVNFVGDNFMAVFSNPEDALASAIAITNKVEVSNEPRRRTAWVRFRMGVDQGPVTITEGDYFGEPLNIAARIQGIAQPGGISVSGDVYRSLDEPALRFRPIGSQRLKNIPEGVEVYEMADLPTSGAQRATGLALEVPTVAVLPIHKEQAGGSAESADLIRRDLIHRLTQVPGLRVIETDAEPGGKLETAARYMIETGVHEITGQVRVFATLFDVNTWNIVKSHKLTVSADELLGVSEQLAEEVARGIEVELIVGEPAGLYDELEDPEAIEKVYLGWYHLRSDTEEGWLRAVDLFGEVAATHPDQPYGHVLSAFANWAGSSNGWGPDPDATLQLALEQAKRGREVGDPTGMAQAVEASVMMSQGREEEALAVVNDLKIIRPTCDVTYGLEGSVRRYMGDWQKSVELMGVAMRLTGLNKPWYPTVQACSLFMGGRLEQAASVAETVLEYQPTNLEALLVLTATQVELGMDRSARASASLIKERFPSVDVAAWLDRNPYQDDGLVGRWKQDLETAGAL